MSLWFGVEGWKAKEKEEEGDESRDLEERKAMRENDLIDVFLHVLPQFQAIESRGKRLLHAIPPFSQRFVC